MSNRVILCIDDESIVLDSLKEQIQQGFGGNLQVEVAESGDEALEIFDELIEDGYEIPIVMADFIMPGMKGDALLEKIHDVKPAAKKILLTGQASLEGVSNAVNRADLYRFISKPWEKQDLILTIREALKSYEQDKTILNQNEELKELNTNLEKKVEQRTKELKELNATKDKFFSIIAHDLKNPFNTMMGFTELMMDNIEDYSGDKLLEFISILHDTSKHSYALLENLLEWSRSQTGRLEMTPELINIHAIFDENADLLLNNATKKKINLSNEINPDIRAFADANMVSTVIRNLLSNAIKYTNEGGSITGSSKANETGVEISVTDSGTGIAPENIEKLFKIDVNYSTKGTAEETGTGLGLILCKEFIKKNDGDIWVESTQGKGSSFKFTLPFKK
ncbi:MAG: hybrid sensor histidine kinase/response regulator [Bacteroidales bacterium]|jgi:signal transduction histidine kinase